MLIVIFTKNMNRKRKLIWLLLCTFLLTAALGGCGGVKKKRKSPQQLYEEGIKSLAGHRSLFFFHVTDYEGAEAAFEEIRSRYSFTTFAPLAELRLADIHYKKEEYPEAIAEYNEFIKMHPNHKEVPYALNRLGLSYFNQIRGVDRDQMAAEGALSNFQVLVERYPDSDYAREASPMIDKCKDTLAGHEFYVGRFYFKTKGYEAAVGRFKRSLERFPGYGPKEDAMLYLGKSYLALDDDERGREVLGRLLRAFPDTRQAGEAAELLGKEKGDR